MTTPLPSLVTGPKLGEATAAKVNTSIENQDHKPEVLATPNTKTSAPMPGIRIGPYVIQDVLGAGGSGRVYKVWDTSLRRSLALKLLPAAHTLDATHVARFKREVETLARLSHPNVVKVFGAGDYEGSPWFVMDLLDGHNLEQLAGTRGLDPRRAATLMLEVARGVHYLHREGVIHRDIKPANIVLTKSGAPVLTDFGLAQTLHQRGDLTRTGLSVGTPAYMSPEQARGHKESVGVGADVWQLGATLFALIAGRPPFRGDSPADIMLKVAEGRGPDFSGVSIPKPLRAVILKAMAERPGARYESADAFGKDLARWLGGEWVMARGGGKFARRIHATRKYWVPAAVALLGTIIITAVLLSGGQQVRELTRPSFFSASPESTLKLVPVGEASVATFDTRNTVTRKDTPRTPESLWMGLETPPDAGPPGHGWGDWTASFEFSPPVPDVKGLWHEEVMLNVTTPPDVLSSPRHPSVLCYVGGDSSLPTRGVCAEVVPSKGWIVVSSRGQPLGYASFATRIAEGPEPLRIALSSRGLTVSVTVTSASDQRQLATLSLHHREFSVPPPEWKSRRMGILTTGASIGVGEVGYQQLAERQDMAELLVANRMFPEALDRITARLGSLGAELSPRERARLEYLRGLCLWKSAADNAEQRQEAMAALSVAENGADPAMAFLASLAHLEMELEAWVAMPEENVVDAREGFPNTAVRRARGLATSDSQIAQVVTLLMRRQFHGARASSFSVWDHRLRGMLLLQTANGEAYRSAPASAWVLGSGFWALKLQLENELTTVESRQANLHFEIRVSTEIARRLELTEWLDGWPVIVFTGTLANAAPLEKDPTVVQVAQDAVMAHVPQLVASLPPSVQVSPPDTAAPVFVPLRNWHYVPALDTLVRKLIEDAATTQFQLPVSTKSREYIAIIRTLQPHANLTPKETDRIGDLLRLLDPKTPPDRQEALESIKRWENKDNGGIVIFPRVPVLTLEHPNNTPLPIWRAIASIIQARDANDSETVKRLAADLAAKTATNPNAWYHRLALAWRDGTPAPSNGG